MRELNWLGHLSQADLLKQIPLAAIESVDDLNVAAIVIIDYLNSGRQLRNKMRTSGEPEGEETKLTKELWSNFKKEFCVLVCSKDKKYQEERKALSSTTVGTLIVAQIACILGDTMGIATGSLVSFVALMLWTLAKVGKSTFCETVCVT